MILGSKEAQEAFNPLKGSIPARTDVNRDIFSPYHQWSMDSFANDALVPSCAHGQASSPAFQQAFYDASTAFVTDKDVDTYLAMLVRCGGDGCGGDRVGRLSPAGDRREFALRRQGAHALPPLPARPGEGNGHASVGSSSLRCIEWRLHLQP